MIPQRRMVKTSLLASSLAADTQYNLFCSQQALLVDLVLNNPWGCFSFGWTCCLSVQGGLGAVAPLVALH